MANLNKSKTNKLFKTFSHELVEIVTKLTMETSMQTENQIESVKQPVIVKGYLLSQDADFYYLSGDAINIDRAIKINEISYIQLSPQANPYMDVLNALPDQAQTEEEVN